MQSARYRVATKPTDASPYTKDTTLNGHTTLSTDRHPLDNRAQCSHERITRPDAHSAPPQRRHVKDHTQRPARAPQERDTKANTVAPGTTARCSDYRFYKHSDIATSPARGDTNSPYREQSKHTPAPGPGPGHPTHASNQRVTDCTTPRPTAQSKDIRNYHTGYSDNTTKDECCQIYSAVAATGRYNYEQARLPLPSGLNIPVWREELNGYHDGLLVELLEFGFPLSFTGGPLTASTRNHHSALAFPTHVREYIRKECEFKALIPADNFPGDVHTSPLMTRPKNKPGQRRIIHDLSWPPGQSVNDSIPKDLYLGRPFKLELPGAQDLAKMMAAHGRGCYIYNVDLARAYRQLRTDPLDWPRQGLSWDGNRYIDIAVPFGARWSASACQRTTTAIAYIAHHHAAPDIVPYIDDFAGVAPNHKQATKNFNTLRNTLKRLGLQEAVDKASAPSTRMRWIGLDFDSENMEIRIPTDKIDQVSALTQAWLNRRYATKHEMQELLGKYFHVGQCVRPARLFLARMLDTLRRTPDAGSHLIDEEFRKDLKWFATYLRDTNGIYIIQPRTRTIEIELDSCLTGCGAICGSQYYALQFPDAVLEQTHHISRLELLNIVVAGRTWAHNYPGTRFLVRCDNTAAVFTLRSARARDKFMLQCARALFLVAAKYQIHIDACHKPGAQMALPDALSRAHLSPSFLERPMLIPNATRVHPTPLAFCIDTIDI